MGRMPIKADNAIITDCAPSIIWSGDAVKLLFLDESGNHQLDRINKDYPVFVLGGIILDRTYARTVVEPRLSALKLEFFGRDDIVLHTTEIVRKQNHFATLEDPVLYEQFLEALTQLMSDVEYEVIACVIKKHAYAERYGAEGLNPYHFSLGILVERFAIDIGPVTNGGLVVVERRRPDLDVALERAWQRLRNTGTPRMSAADLDDRIIDLSVKDKSLNLAGLQLADLVVSPIGRAAIGKPTRADWDVVKSKLRRRNGTYQDHGLVILPR